MVDGTEQPRDPTGLGIRQRWANFRNRPGKNGQPRQHGNTSADENEDMTTILVQCEPGTNPVRVAMKRAGAAIGGGCMLVVGVPLLLFPGIFYLLKCLLFDWILLVSPSFYVCYVYVVPGPGVAMIASGVYVISTEYQFAQRWLTDIQARFGNVLDKVGFDVGDPVPQTTIDMLNTSGGPQLLPLSSLEATGETPSSVHAKLLDR